MVIYTNDCLIFAENDNIINTLIDKQSATY